MSDFNQDCDTQDMLERYGQGESLSELAAELGLEESALRSRMKKYDFKEYKKSKGENAQARMTLRHAENKFILSKNRENVIDTITDEDKMKKVTVKDMCTIEKTFGDRVALAEGEATDSIEHKGSVGNIIINPPKDDDNG